MKGWGDWSFKTFEVQGRIPQLSHDGILRKCSPVVSEVGSCDVLDEAGIARVRGIEPRFLCSECCLRDYLVFQYFRLLGVTRKL
jgi:hypothetical protein